MNTSEILSHVDHTLLKAFATWEDIVQIAEDALEYNTASICIPQTYIARLHEKYGDKLNICTVVGFPLGYNSTESKITEVKQALADGANEIDMVVNISDVKNGDYDKVEKEIATLKEVCGNKILKVIIETCYLTQEEKIAMCHAVTNAKADYIKTSTGFGTAGATMDDILLFKEHIGPNVKMKAAGGIRTVEDMENFLAVGVDRLGTSGAIKLVKGQESKGY
ncbi:MAG: deoxyribose-phosphate aldolase [Erysipelotrichaceae bacterium]|nr:deoxyribose-phosphate aldolase [Erysipelotrichaceae bacterium]MBR3694579.1 deoxyribose-phosphate aldolase [Erysipelotrichales bacterium]